MTAGFARPVGSYCGWAFGRRSDMRFTTLSLRKNSDARFRAGLGFSAL